jgi:hypothetical protein
MQNRVIFSDNGTLTDYSVELSTFTEETVSLATTTGEDYLYIGSDLPFNHKYFLIETANEDAAAVTIEYWDGNAWIEAVDVLDSTKSTGASMGKNGHIQYSFDDDKTSWGADDAEDITGISTLHIENLFWLRLSWSASIDFTLRYIGHRFSADADLATYYPELSKSAVKAQFASGKTDWDHQTLAAANEIIRDLKIKRIVLSPNQILDWRKFRTASIHKLAELIFNAFGDDYVNNLQASRAYYVEAMNQVYFDIDANRNAKLDRSERSFSSGFMKR